MIKRYLFLPLFLSFCFSQLIFAEGWQSKEERIQAVNIEIEKLMQQKEKLVELKQHIQNENHSQPKIALVLSGGGAKGAAHIGVLKVLEQNQIPIDLIVGTSIGSIVGGMYSIGYSPEEIEKLVLSLPFRKLFTDSKDKKLQTVEDHISNQKYPLHLHLDKELNLSVPTGFLNGQNIYFQLKDIFMPASQVQDFDQLPIPFRAVSTNLQTGKEEILSHGDLPLAIFRSMAIPALLSPVETDEQYYVDGGVVNNFPVDVAISMGADIVIGVDITANDSKITEDSNVISVIDRISSYNGNRSTQFHKQLANILIVPDVKNHNTVNFSHMDKLIIEGEKAAHKYDDVLAKLADSNRFYNIKNKRMADSSILIKNIAVEGNQSITLQQIKDFDPKPKNRMYQKADLEKWSRKIYANTYVDNVHYYVQGDTIYFKIHEKKAVGINTGIAYTTKYGGSLNIAFNVPVFFRNYTNHLGVKLELSDYPKMDLYASSIYKVRENSIYAQGKIFIHKEPLFFYEKGKQLGNYSTQNIGVKALLGTEILREWMLDYEFSYLASTYRYEQGKREIEDFKQNYQFIGNQMQIQKDTLDSSLFPTKGYHAKAKGFTKNSVGSHKVDIAAYQFDLQHYIPISSHISLFASTGLGKIYGEHIPANEHFKIGGSYVFRDSVAMVGFPVYSLLAKEYTYLGGGIQYKIFDNFNLIAKYNFVKYQDFLHHTQAEQSFGIGAGVNSFLGPIVFIISKRKKYASPVFEINLGYPF